MRVWFYIFMLCSASALATPVGIEAVSQNGHPGYMVDVGAFPHENNALQLKFKLDTLFHGKTSIDYSSTAHDYHVKLGPFDKLSTAKTIQSELKTDVPQAVASPAASPQSLDTAQTDGQPAKMPLWNLRNADIRAVIAAVSRLTGKNFVIDPRVQGKITLVTNTPIPPDELYQVFLSVLQVSGYAAINSNNVTKIVPSMEAKATEDSAGPPPDGEEMMVQVIPIHYIPAEHLIPVLRPLMPPWSNLSACGPSNRLVLFGRADNIRQLAKIIKQVDSSSANGVDMIPLHHALAMDVVNTLNAFVKTNNNPAQAPTTLAADDRSNTILLGGPRMSRLRLRLLIAKLDHRNTGSTNSNTQVVYLNYLRAEDLVPILAGIAQANFSGAVGTTIGTITRPVLDSTNPASNVANTAGGGTNSSTPAASPSNNSTNANAASPSTSQTATQTEGSSKPSIQIIAEPNTNSIILNAPASLIRTLRQVISKLDIRPAQILIEALVAEVDEEDVASLGIEWGSNQQTGKPSSFRPGFAIINNKTSLTDFQAQLYALANDRKANILSTPSVLVLDNRQAKILVGKQVSVASTTYPNNAGGTTTASPYVTYDRVNVALHLYVRPQITRGRGIEMQIDQGNDTLDPAVTDNTTNPTFRISSIVTDVHVESGDIVVLGGLRQDSLGNDNNRIPILGDIPGLGRLFQHNISNRDKRVLMVFISPIIMRNERDTMDISQEKYHDLRQEELRWLRTQPYHPGNEKIVMAPMKSALLPRPFSRRTVCSGKNCGK